MVTRLHWLLTHVACVEEPFPSLGVQRDKHGQGGVLGSSKGGELPVFLPSQGEEGISALHQVAAEERVWVTGDVS